MRLPARTFALATLAVAAAGCASTSPEPRSVTVDLAGPGGRQGSLSVSSEAVDSLVGAVMDGTSCRDIDLDPDLEGVLLKLERADRSRITVTGEDGRLTTRRRGGQLVVEFEGHEGGGVRLELPWGVAECLLGRVDTLDRALSHHRHPKARIELRSAEHEAYTLEIELR